MAASDLINLSGLIDDAKCDKPPLSGPGKMLVQHGHGRLM